MKKAGVHWCWLLEMRLGAVVANGSYLDTRLTLSEWVTTRLREVCVCVLWAGLSTFATECLVCSVPVSGDHRMN